MNQNVWGKCAWVFIHTIAINYPENPSTTEKENVIKFFTSMGDILPCRYCREHYRKNLKILPIRADSKMDLVYWTIDLHNKVNDDIGKPILPREEALRKVMALYKNNPDNPEGYYFLYLGTLLLFFISVYFFIKK
jgi:FAD-linked sulfhydryl oxidase